MNPVAYRLKHGPQSAGWYIYHAIKYLGMAFVALIVAYLIIAGVEGHMNKPEGPPAWLYDVGEPVEIGTWRGHHFCWAVVNEAHPKVFGAVGCADGYREMYR